MALTRVKSAGVTNNAIGSSQLDLTANYAFTGTITGAGEALEEGTWTPVMTSFNHTTQIGRYIKIGKMVTVHAHIVGTSTRSGASISVGGLPYTVNTTSNFYQSAIVGGHSYFGYTTSFDDVTARFDPNSTNITFLRNRQNNNHDGVQATQQGTSTQIFHIGGTYISA
tara:strand:- start:216 stop:719 length:504 start_codon:yes stop_codon:yes gene_type:complete